MKYTIISRSQLLIEVEGKKLLVEGEATLDKKFYANIRSMKSWEPPYQNVLVSEQEKMEIINAVSNVINDSGIKVIFE